MNLHPLRDLATEWRERLRRVVEVVPDDELADLVGELARLEALARVRLSHDIAPPGAGERAAPEDRYLKAEDVADRLRVSKQWVHGHRTELGGVKLSEGCLRFRERDVERYLDARRRDDRP